MCSSLNFRKGPRPAFFVLLAAVAAGAALLLLRPRGGDAPPGPGVAWGNGRLEAVEVDVSAKVVGRLVELVPAEGEPVSRGLIVARLDADEPAARLVSAEAGERRARAAELAAKEAVAAATSRVKLAEGALRRSEELAPASAVSRDQLDRDKAELDAAKAGLAVALAQVAEAAAARDMAAAAVEERRCALDDTVLKCPVDGRVLYRLAEPGEVLAPGGKALTVLDLSDVFMAVFLPAAEAARTPVGAPAQIVLDGMADTPVPAHVSFVSPRAQFTPKEVETRSEREKLMFRVKVRVDREWMAKHPDLAKPGMPGVAHIRLSTTPGSAVEPKD